MIRFGLIPYERNAEFILHWEKLLFAAANTPGANKLNEKEKRQVLAILAESSKHCRTLDLKHSLEYIEMIERDFNTHIEGYCPPYGDTALHLRNLWNEMQREISEKHFAFIPRFDFFEKDNLFGEEVSQAFPSECGDIRNAGNCIAASLWTAAIFHLMRVAELGMRALARHLRVKIQKTKKAKGAQTCPNCKAVISVAIPAKVTLVPLDYAMWEEVLTALEKKIKDTQRTKKGETRDSNYQFYHGLIIELNAFKDLWRNDVSHCRRDFGEPDVDQVYPHVKDFMKRLATKVAEKNYEK